MEQPARCTRSSPPSFVLLTSVYDPPRSNVWRQVLDLLLQQLFPSPCLGCDGLAPDGLDGLGLCPCCRGQIPRLRPPLCHRCCLPLSVAHPPPTFTCLACRHKPPAYDRLIALWSYEPPVDAVIGALKFSHHADLARPLGRQMAERLEMEDAAFDVFTFVPLHWQRRLARGYDQAEEITRALTHQSGRRPHRTLRRRRATRAQSRLSRNERVANLTSAFALRRNTDLSGQSVLLVDDVVTSGATIAAAAGCLKAAGAFTVTAAVVARTPRPGDSKSPRPASHGPSSLLQRASTGGIQAPAGRF